MEQEDKKVRLENTGQIELPKFDAEKYIGKTTTIISVEEFKGEHGYYVILTSDVLEEGTDIRATKLLGLQTITKEDGTQRIGWGVETKMGVFLAKHGVEHYNHMVGKTVIVQTRINKQKKEFLTF